MTMRIKPAMPLAAAGMILSVLVGAISLACSPTTTSNVAVGEVLEGEEGQTLQKDYVVKDKILAKEIQVLDVKARYVGDFLEGLAIVKNRRKYTVDFEYKFEWYDEKGFPVESSVVHWTPDLLYGLESKWIQALCPRAGATKERRAFR
jgi:uncharacterized protein YcfL